jgi:hypothetical protein
MAALADGTGFDLIIGGQPGTREKKAATSMRRARSAFGSDAFEKNGCRFVGGILRDQFATEGLGAQSANGSERSRIGGTEVGLH